MELLLEKPAQLLSVIAAKTEINGVQKTEVRDLEGQCQWLILTGTQNWWTSTPAFHFADGETKAQEGENYLSSGRRVSMSAYTRT